MLIYAHLLHVIGPLFMPSTDAKSVTINSFISFALGYIFRPIGGLIFGHLGDKLGRKKTLALSITLMSLPTFIIGSLPVYEQIGIWSGIILCLCRAVQSLSVGGETPAAATLLVENSTKARINLTSSLLNVAIYTAGIIGGIVGFICTQSFMPEWGWRIAFFFGAALAFFGLYIRLKTPETPAFEEIRRQKKIIKAPIMECFKNDKLSLFCSFGFAGGIITGGSFIMAYIPNVLRSQFSFETPSVLLTTIIFMLLSIVGLLLCGLWADRIGTKRVMRIGACLVICFVPCVLFSADQNDLLLFLLFQSLACFSFSALTAPLNAMNVILFPTNRRISGAAFSYGLGAIVFGGLTPLICQLLKDWTGSFWGPSLYVIFCQLLALTAIYFAPNVLKDR